MSRLDRDGPRLAGHRAEFDGRAMDGDGVDHDLILRWAQPSLVEPASVLSERSMQESPSRGSYSALPRGAPAGARGNS
jgi:hypothetical protein